MSAVDVVGLTVPVGLSPACVVVDQDWETLSGRIAVESVLNEAWVLNTSRLAAIEQRGFDLGERALQRLTNAIRRALVVHGDRIKRHPTKLFDILQTVRDELRALDRDGHGQPLQRADHAGLVPVVAGEVVDPLAELGDVAAVRGYGAFDGCAELAVRRILRFIVIFCQLDLSLVPDSEAGVCPAVESWRTDCPGWADA